jgi:hypothetical protein
MGANGWGDLSHIVMTARPRRGEGHPRGSLFVSNG